MSGLPKYLMDVDEDPDHYYGELYYLRDTGHWLIKGEPRVCQMAKRLFPGSAGRRSGEAKFKRSKRTNGDLNWLMLRYPLKIMDMETWEDDFEEAKEHVIKRIDISKRKQKMEPSAKFNGTLREFQKEAVAFLSHNAPTMLADEMGLGKTVCALAWISNLEASRGIIVLPKNIQEQWRTSIVRFMGIEEDKVHIISGLTPYELPEAEFYIIHYGLLRGWKRELPEENFDFLVFDEIQELRHRGTEKYSASSLLAESVPERIGMSGTPIYNTGGEMWNVLNIIEFQCLGDWDSFSREWCYGYGSDIVTDPQMLGDYLKREGLMIRRTKDEVLDELPDKRRIISDIQGDGRVFNNHIKKALNLVSRFDKSEDHLEKGRLMRLIDTETRLATGISKAKEVVEFVKMLLESGERVVLYGWHHQVYEAWLDGLGQYRPGLITGKQSGKQKLESKERFLKGDTSLLIISLRAAAGLDGLQEVASVNVFGELDWSPGVHSQCEDRLHRIGQRDSVLSYYMVNSEGMDEAMIEALGFKTSQFAGIMGDKVETQEDKVLAQVKVSEHMDKVMDSLRKKVG